MDKNIGILHISDIHISSKNSSTVIRLVEQLKADIAKVTHENDVEIKLVCISGDLINSGDNASTELELAMDLLVQPLMETLGLTAQCIFVVPGNHEVKRNRIVPYIENGLESTLISEDRITDFLHNIDDHSISRISYFNEEFSSLFGGTPVWENPLSKAYLLNMGNITIGIACINSAWRSTGIGSAEKRKMIIGQKQIVDCFERIKAADLKICVVHHPFDWLVDDDKVAVEKCINQFDIVLNGHIHESDTKQYTTFNGQTLFNTCGKFDDTSDIYNGYTIISINPFNKDCTVFLRQHFGFPRNCFDAALCVAENGLFTTNVGSKSDLSALAYNISHSIEPNFLEYANSFFVSNVTAGHIAKTFNESFIIPEFNRYSEYEKETMIDTEEKDKESDVVTLEELCTDKSNILLLGKKEAGKTTILHYIAKFYFSNFNSLRTVPIVLDASQIDYSGKNVISRAIQKFINNFCADNDSFSMKDIDYLIQAGMFTIMFDSFDSVKPNELKKINEFIETYPSNRFIFSERESISSRYMRDIAVLPCCAFETVHISSLSKRQIRSVAIQNFTNQDSATVVDKIMLCFKKTALPRTPFILSLILSLCNSADFSPINEAVILEQFTDHLLEKSAPTEAHAGTFDFHNKEDFLIHLASFMNNQNRFYIFIQEFETLLLNYHNEIGFSINDTKFDDYFFKRGLLVNNNQVVSFRYNCLLEFYLAKKAHQSPEFLSDILSDRNYLNYPNELLYFTGLNRKNKDVIQVLNRDLFSDLNLLRGLIPQIEEYNIGLDISVPEELFSERIQRSKLTQEESDTLQNTTDTSDAYPPTEINKHIEHSDMDAFVQTLLIYGNSLKNLELISASEKEKMYNTYILGLCIMLGLLKLRTEEFFKEELSSMEELPEKFTEADIEEFKTLVEDVLKISLPIALQNIALENIGTVKLKSIIEKGINNNTEGAFSEFFSVFLYCDLRLPGLRDILNSYCSSVKNKSLLKIIFFKLLYYYRYRYFSSSLDPFFENILADINIKLHGTNKFKKSNIIKGIKEQRRLINPQ